MFRFDWLIYQFAAEESGKDAFTFIDALLIQQELLRLNTAQRRMWYKACVYVYNIGSSRECATDDLAFMLYYLEGGGGVWPGDLVASVMSLSFLLEGIGFEVFGEYLDWIPLKTLWI